MKKLSILNNIVSLWTYLGKKRRLQFILLFMLMMISVLFEIISIGAIVPFLTALTNPEVLMQVPWFHNVMYILGIETKDEILLPLTVGFVCIAVFAAAIRILLLWSNARLGASMGIQLRRDVYERTLCQPYEYHISHNSSELISMATEKVGLAIQAGIIHVLMFISAMVISIAIILTLLFINTNVALFTFFILGGGYFLVGYFVKKNIQNNGNIIAVNQPDAVKCMQEGLGGIRDIILDKNQNIFINLYEKVATNIQLAGMQNAFLGGLPKSLLEVLGITLIATLAYYLQSSQTDGGSVLPVLGALALGAQRLLPSLQQMYFSWTKINENQTILEEVLLQLSSPIYNQSKDTINHSFLKFENKITLKDLTFKYYGSDKNLFNKLNLKIPKGTRIGFIGKTGSGKSTLLDIVMGFLKPTEGTLSVDDIEINEKNISAWQSHIAHVPQSIFLSDSSILENIAFGIPKKDIDIQKVKASAVKASLNEFIDSLPNGYDTHVGERGVQLSGGQRQRIGIARAMYKQADVIIFDEATSALDDATEISVMNAIDALDHDLTLMIIAHRLSTLKVCDIVCRLDKGIIVELGTYDEIVNAK